MTNVVPQIIEETFVLGCEQGGREYMEDRSFACDSLVPTAQEARIFLRRLFHEAAQETSTLVPGTTATVALLTPDGFLTLAHLGDSPAMLFWEKTGQQVTGLDLVFPHLPSDPTEKARILAAGGKFEGDIFLNQMENHKLEMSRSLGDALFTGVGREPTFTSFNLAEEIPQNVDAAYLCLSSDGIIGPPNPDSARDHARYSFEEGLGDRVDVYNELLGSTLDCKKSDNLTLCVVDLKKQKEGLAVGIFDGHGGASTADLVCRLARRRVLGYRPAPR